MLLHLWGGNDLLLMHPGHGYSWVSTLMSPSYYSNTPNEFSFHGKKTLYITAYVTQVRNIALDPEFPILDVVTGVVVKARLVPQALNLVHCPDLVVDPAYGQGRAVTPTTALKILENLQDTDQTKRT